MTSHRCDCHYLARHGPALHHVHHTVLEAHQRHLDGDLTTFTQSGGDGKKFEYQPILYPRNQPDQYLYIYIPRSRSVSTFLSEGNEVVQPTITSFSWFHNMLKELLQRLSIPYTLPEIKHG